MPTVPGFIGPIELLGRIVEGEDETFMLEPMDVFGELPIGREPLPVRFKDGDDNRGLNAGCPCDETRNGPEF
jgi:hypothetical protein